MIDTVIVDENGNIIETEVCKEHFSRFYDPSKEYAVCPDLDLLLSHRDLYNEWKNEDNPIVNNARRIYETLNRLQEDW